MTSSRTPNHIFWNSVGSLTFAAKSTLLFFLIVHLLGIDSAGEFAVTFAASQTLLMIGYFGVGTHQMVDFDHIYSFPDYLSSKCLTNLMMLLSAAALIASGFFSGNKILLFSLSMAVTLSDSFADVFQNHYFQENRLDLSGKCLFTRNLASILAFAIVFYLVRDTAAGLCAIILADLFLSGYLFLIPFGKRGILCLSKDMRRIKRLLFTCLPLFGSLFLITYMVNCTKYVIELFCDDATQGYYGILIFPAICINLFSGFIYKPILQRMAAYVRDNQKTRFRTLIVRQILLIFILSGCACAVVALGGDRIVLWIFGVASQEYATEFILIISGGCFSAISSFFYFTFVVLKRHGMIFFCYLFGAAAETAMAVFLVSRYAITGAAAAYFFGYIVLSAVFGLLLVGEFNAWERRLS